jgi:D-glutamate cyclase
VSERTLQQICDLIQDDVSNRGLRTDPHSNLITATAGDFQSACRSLAETPDPAVVIVTGFYIPHAQPPCGETDGPLGALFLARAFMQLGIHVVLATDAFCVRALTVGLETCELEVHVPLIVLPPGKGLAVKYWSALIARLASVPFKPTHLLALERVGPSHTVASVRAQCGANEQSVDDFIREVPPEHHDRCHTMLGRDVTTTMSPAHLLFESPPHQTPAITTIGIGDGGNEIGMGKTPWEIIRRNVPNGGLIACRVPTDRLIVAGVSNWGAYGLAAGTALLRGHRLGRGLFDVEGEHELLRVMVEQGPLVDGVTGQPTVTVDGLPFERYAEPLRRIGELVVPS